MLNLDEINTTITELECQKLTFDICNKLANLYILRDNCTVKEDANDEVRKEYFDILPSYSTYCEMKKRYQLSEVSDFVVYDKLKSVCNEISEFLLILYNNTDTKAERIIIKDMITNVHTDLKKSE